MPPAPSAARKAQSAAEKEKSASASASRSVRGGGAASTTAASAAADSGDDSAPIMSLFAAAPNSRERSPSGRAALFGNNFRGGDDVPPPTPLAILTSRRRTNGRFLSALRNVRAAMDGTRGALEGAAGSLYAIETDYVPAAAGLAGLRSTAAMIDWRRTLLGFDDSDAAAARLPLRCVSQQPNGPYPLGPHNAFGAAGNATSVLAINRLLRARDYVSEPLRSAEMGFLVNSGSNDSAKASGGSTGPSTPTASSTSLSAFPTVAAATVGTAAEEEEHQHQLSQQQQLATVRLHHGWAVVGHEAMVEAADSSTYAANLTADARRTASLSYGPSMALLEDASSRAVLRGRWGAAADGGLAAALGKLKSADVAAASAILEGEGSKEMVAGSGFGNVGGEHYFAHPMALIRKDVA